MRRGWPAWKKVPAVVRELTRDQELLEVALVENVQRADLNPLEEAEAYQSLGQRHGLNHEEIARRVGKSRATISNSLRLLRLGDEVQDMLRDGRLTAGQARPLLALDPEAQVKLALRAVEEGLSARTLEELAGGGKKPPEAQEAARGPSYPRRGGKTDQDPPDTRRHSPPGLGRRDPDRISLGRGTDAAI